MRKDIDEKKDWIIEQLESGKSRASIAVVLKCRAATLTSRLEKWGYAHLKNQSGKGNPKYGCRKPITDYLKVGTLIPSYRLKLRLWDEGLKPKRCELCDLETWRGQPAPLELDHINGDCYDNRLENLRILCGHCHALTDSYCKRNSVR